jgi:hypothetical protein
MLIKCWLDDVELEIEFMGIVEEFLSEWPYDIVLDY